jgi:hypothetical protein
MMDLCEDDFRACLKEHVQPFCGGGKDFTTFIEVSRVKEIIQDMESTTLEDVLEFIRDCENPYMLDEIWKIMKDRMY